MPGTAAIAPTAPIPGAGSLTASPLRVLMIAARSFPFVGGIETHIHEVGCRLSARGHDVEVLTTDATWKLPRIENVQGVKVVRVRAWPRGRDYYWAPGILRHVAAGDWDVIHIQGYHTFSAPLGMIAALRKRIPFVITFHSGGHSSVSRNAIRRLQHALLAPLIARAATPIGVSQFEARFFSERLGLARSAFAVVPNGARMPGASRKAPRSDGGALILSVGRLERYKGHQRVIMGFHELLRTRPGARLRVLGEGPYEPELRRLTARLGLEGRVEIGGIPAARREEIADLMRGAALVVLMSDYEAHPVAVMEALSLDVPVLTSDTSGFRELAEAGMVRAVPIGADPAEMAKAMHEEIAAIRSTREIELPDWDECADRLESIYRNAAQSNKSAVSRNYADNTSRPPLGGSEGAPNGR